MAREPFLVYAVSDHEIGLMTEVTQHDDGMVEVLVRMYGCEERGWVSSWHLVDTKAKQLEEAIVRSCKEAYGTGTNAVGCAD